MSLEPEFLSFTCLMNSPILETSPISSSMLSAASLAPPCAGPHRHAMPAAIQANGFAPEEPDRRTVEVDAFCSWSACRIRIRSRARTSTSLTLYSSHGLPNIMRMKLALYDRSLRGYTKGWPIEYLYDIATSVGILAIRRIADTSRCVALLMSSESW